MTGDIIGLVRAGTKKWTRTRKVEQRNPASRSYRMSRLTRERGVSFKEAAWECMEQAYRHVSGPDGLPANARQIMYAARNSEANRPTADIKLFHPDAAPRLRARNWCCLEHCLRCSRAF